MAWASGIGASFRALAGGSEGHEDELAATLASILGTATAAPVPLLETTAELLEALLESSRVQGEPWSTAALDALALDTAASAKASADAASLRFTGSAAAGEHGKHDSNYDEAAGGAAVAAAIARLRACTVLVSTDVAWTRRGGPGSLALLDTLAHGAGLPGSQWRPLCSYDMVNDGTSNATSSGAGSGNSGSSSSSKIIPNASPWLRRASAVCLNYWAKADFRSSHTATHPALVNGEAHQALLARLLAPSVHAPPSGTAAAAEPHDEDGDDEVDEDELSEWLAFREQDVADALSACHLALGSGTYIQTVLSTMNAAVAATMNTSPPHLVEGIDAMPAFALFAVRVVAIEASRRALLAQAPEATLLAATKRDPRLNNRHNNSSNSMCSSDSPETLARADAKAADAALFEVVSMVLAGNAVAGNGTTGAELGSWSVANPLVAGEACRLLAVVGRWLVEAPSSQHAQILPRALEFALGPTLGPPRPHPSSFPHGWMLQQQQQGTINSSNSSGSVSTAGKPELFAGECVRNLCSRAAATLATPTHLSNLSGALESATARGVLTDPEARCACAHGLCRILSQLSPPDATAALKAIAAPSLARLAAACSKISSSNSSGNSNSNSGSVVGQLHHDAMAAATTEVRVLAVLVRGTRATADSLRDLPTDPSSAGAGAGAAGTSSTADRKSALLEAEASPPVALLNDAWPVLQAAAGTLTALGTSSTGGGGGGGNGAVLAAALVELLWFAAVLPLRRRTDVLAAACRLAGQLTPFAPLEVLKLVEEVAEQWGHRAEADAATAVRTVAAEAGGAGLVTATSETVAARLPDGSHGATLAALAMPTLGAVAQSLTQALTKGNGINNSSYNPSAYSPDLCTALLNAARAYVSHCPATLALCGKSAWEMLTDLAAAVASRPELEPAMAALRCLGLVVTLQVTMMHNNISGANDHNNTVLPLACQMCRTDSQETSCIFELLRLCFHLCCLQTGAPQCRRSRSQSHGKRSCCHQHQRKPSQRQQWPSSFNSSVSSAGSSVATSWPTFPDGSGAPRPCPRLALLGLVLRWRA